MERKTMRRPRLQKIEPGHYETPDGRFRVRQVGTGPTGWQVTDRLGGGKRTATKRDGLTWIHRRLRFEAGCPDSVGGPEDGTEPEPVRRRTCGRCFHQLEDGRLACDVCGCEEVLIPAEGQDQAQAARVTGEPVEGLSRAVQAAVDLVATLRALALAGASAAEALEGLGRLVAQRKEAGGLTWEPAELSEADRRFLDQREAALSPAKRADP